MWAALPLLSEIPGYKAHIMIPRRKSLAILTRKRLLELGERLKVAGLIGKTKDQIIDSIAAKRSIKIDEWLKLFRLEEVSVHVVGTLRVPSQMFPQLSSGSVDGTRCAYYVPGRERLQRQPWESGHGQKVGKQ
jgi:hypothetical protein